MKVLSLKQPFAELVVSGKKTIDIRKWNTHFRGTFLVHASLSVDKDAMKKHGYDDLPRGVIVGKADLKEVKKYSNKSEFMKDRKKHLATIDYGMYGFVLQNAKRVKEIPAKGKLGFWDLDSFL